MGGKKLPSAPNGIFQVWNPLYEPQTVYIHARELVENGAKSVLWGKIGRPASEANDELIQRMKKSPRNKYLLVTDYLSFHICPIKRIISANEGNDPALAPEYYKNKQVSYWYEITDVVLISGDQTRTLNELRKLHLQHPEGKALDIYSQRDLKFPLPVFVDKPAVDNWITHGVKAKDSLGLPVRILDTMKEIQEMVGVEKFSTLPDKSKVFLAQGYRHYKEQASYEKKAWELSAFPITMAYETILKEHLAPALCELRNANKDKSQIKELFVSRTRNNKSRNFTLKELLDKPGDGPTLGELGIILRAIANNTNMHFIYLRFLGGPKSFLFKDFMGDKFFRNTLVYLRNQSAHLGCITEDKMNRFVDFTLQKKYLFELSAAVPVLNRPGE